MSKDSLKRLKEKSDLRNNVAEIFDVPQNLDCTSSGHYSIPFCDHDVDTNTCLLINNEDESDERNIKSSSLKKSKFTRYEILEKLFLRYSERNTHKLCHCLNLRKLFQDQLLVCYYISQF